MHAKQIAKLTMKATEDVDKDNKEKVEVVIATRVSPDQFAHIKGLMGDEVVRYRPHSRIAHTIVSGEKYKQQTIVRIFTSLYTYIHTYIHTP
jgi:hypothetical protein